VIADKRFRLKSMLDKIRPASATPVSLGEPETISIASNSASAIASLPSFSIFFPWAAIRVPIFDHRISSDRGSFFGDDRFLVDQFDSGIA
jgi:hypothetical protein